MTDTQEAQSLKPGEWQPIETAPNGVEIVVLYDNGQAVLMSAEDNDYDWAPYPGWSDYCSRPQFWLLLPPAPPSLGLLGEPA